MAQEFLDCIPTTKDSDYWRIEEENKYGEEKGIFRSIRNLMETTSWTAGATMDDLKILEAGLDI